MVGKWGVGFSDNGDAEVVAEEVDGVLVAFGGEGWDAFEGIGDAELLVFVGAHRVVGKEFDALHIVIYSEVLG